VYSICSGFILDQGKQGRNKGEIREISGKMTSLNWQTPCFPFLNLLVLLFQNLPLLFIAVTVKLMELYYDEYLSLLFSS